MFNLSDDSHNASTLPFFSALKVGPISGKASFEAVHAKPKVLTWGLQPQVFAIAGGVRRIHNLFTNFP